MTSTPSAAAFAGFSVAATALSAFLRLRRGSKGSSSSGDLGAAACAQFKSDPLTDVLNIELDSKAYVELLRKLIGEAKHVQNAPPDLVPREDKVVAHIVNFLKPYSSESGGALQVQTISYVKGKLVWDCYRLGSIYCDRYGCISTESCSSPAAKANCYVAVYTDIIWLLLGLCEGAERLICVVIGRSNIVIKYPGTVKGSKPIGLIGMHLDVGECICGMNIHTKLVYF